jgi:flagellar biosynthesis/type III secretory pathway M-ring protein FliF/YscJ
VVQCDRPVRSSISHHHPESAACDSPLELALTPRRWRNFGLLWVYVVFNIFAAVFFYWLARVPKNKGKEQAEESTSDEVKPIEEARDGADLSEAATARVGEKRDLGQPQLPTSELEPKSEYENEAGSGNGIAPTAEKQQHV